MILSYKQLNKKTDKLVKKIINELPKDISELEFSYYHNKIFELMEGYKVHAFNFYNCSNYLNENSNFISFSHSNSKQEFYLKGMNRHLKEAYMVIDVAHKISKFSDDEKKINLERLANTPYMSKFSINA